MWRRNKGLILVSLLFINCTISANVYSNGNVQNQACLSELTADEAPHFRYKVTHVYDGDTVRLEQGQRIRLLGINTPEVRSRYQQGEAGGLAAKKWLEKKLQNQTVCLEFDHQREDKYHRLLAHLFLVSGEHINVSLVMTGLATATIIPPNLDYAEELIAAQRQAEADKKGIWAMDAYQASPISTLSKKKRASTWQRHLLTANTITQSKKFVRLVVQDTIDIRIPKQNLALFPKLTDYLGKPLEVRAWGSRRKGHYSILVRHPSAIIFL